MESPSSPLNINALNPNCFTFSIPQSYVPAVALSLRRRVPNLEGLRDDGKPGRGDEPEAPGRREPHQVSHGAYSPSMK